MTTGDGNAKSKYRMFGASLNEQTSMEIKGYCSLAKVSQRMVLEHGFAMVEQTFQNSEKVPHDFSSAAGSCILLVHVPPELLQQIALFRTQHRLSNRDVLMHAFKVYSKAHPIFSLNDLQKW